MGNLSKVQKFWFSGSLEWSPDIKYLRWNECRWYINLTLKIIWKSNKHRVVKNTKELGTQLNWTYIMCSAVSKSMLEMDLFILLSRSFIREKYHIYFWKHFDTLLISAYTYIMSKHNWGTLDIAFIHITNINY